VAAAAVARRADLAIVGGGPAGLGLAIAARLAGLGVVVLDPRRPPIDKACGEGVMPDGVALLERWGVRLDPRHCSPFRGIRFLDGDRVAQGEFPAAPGLAVRRLELHQALAARAAELGADLRWGTAARGLAAGGVATAGGPVAADWVAGADGLHSRVRRWLGLDGGPGPRPRYGVRRHFGRAPWTDHVEVYWGEGCEAYVTGVGPEEVGVAMLRSGPPAAFDALLERFPVLGARLHGAPRRSRDRGAGPFHQRARGVVRGRAALLGDAGGYLDPITGEGLALTFHQSLALVEAVLAGDLGPYARAHRRIVRRAETMTRLLLVAERRPAVRRRMMRLLASDPALFSRLLAVHSRAAPPRSLGWSGVLRLGLALLAPAGR
jgi:flavin-dependent dehydrogenase